MKNRRIILWLVVGIAVLAIANFMLSRNESRKTTLVARTSLLSIPDDEISLLEISRGGKVECVLAKSEDWRILEPYPGGADEAAVLRLLDVVSTARINDWIGDKELLKLNCTRESFHLSPPRISVRFRSESRETTVSFGKLTPSASEVYAAVDDIPTVFVVPSNTLAAVDVPSSSFRRRDLFSVKDASVSSFDIKGGGEFITFVKDGEVWMMKKPLDGPASSTKVNKLLSDVLSARAVDFIWSTGGTNELAAASASGAGDIQLQAAATNEVEKLSASVRSGYGLDEESAVTLSFKSADGVEHRIAFGSPASDGLVYALVDSARPVVTVDRALKELASLGSTAYADTRLFPYEATQVTGLSLVDDGVACLLAKQEDGTWRMDTPVAADADSSAVESLVTAVLALRGEDADENGVEVSVSSDKRKARVYRHSLGANFRLENLRSLDIQKIEPTIVRRLTVTGSETNKTTAISFDPERNAWNVESSPVQGTVNAAAVESVLASVNPLRAARIVKLKVSATELSTYGLDKPRLTVAIDLERKDSVRRNILVGERAEGGFYATVGASDAVFVLPYKTYLDLSQELVGESN